MKQREGTKIVAARSYGGKRIVYVHLPKAGGRSIWETFSQYFGQTASLNCTVDHVVDPSSLWNIDPHQWEREASEFAHRIPDEIRYIQGHFPATRFLDRLEGFFFTWIRHPYHRALSNYYFWKSLPPSGHSLQDHVIKYQLSFERYIELPLVQNLMTRHFFPQESFWKLDFCGFQETFSEDFGHLCERLGIAVQQPRHSNTTQYPAHEYRELLDSPSVFQRFCQLNRDDMDLYWLAKELREKRVATSRRVGTTS